VCVVCLRIASLKATALAVSNGISNLLLYVAQTLRYQLQVTSGILPRRAGCFNCLKRRFNRLSRRSELMTLVASESFVISLEYLLSIYLRFI
jgi:hypothetical protein